MQVFVLNTNLPTHPFENLMLKSYVTLNTQFYVLFWPKHLSIFVPSYQILI